MADAGNLELKSVVVAEYEQIYLSGRYVAGGSDLFYIAHGHRTIMDIFFAIDNLTYSVIDASINFPLLANTTDITPSVQDYSISTSSSYPVEDTFTPTYNHYYGPSIWIDDHYETKITANSYIEVEKYHTNKI